MCIFDCQVLPLIVCNAFLCVYLESVCTAFPREHTVSHRYTHSQTGLSTAVTRPEQNTRWCLLLCKWILLIFVSTLVLLFFSLRGYFPLTNTARWTKIMILTVRLMWTTNPIIPPPPPTLPRVFVWRPWYVSKSSFLHLSVKCNGTGGNLNVNGWVWVCVVCDIVKRVWESIETHDSPPQVFNPMFDRSWTRAPEGATCTLRVHLRGDQRVHRHF